MELFRTDFEEGNFTAWPTTFGAPTVQNVIKHHGTYAAYFNANEGCSHAIAGAIAYMRAYVYFDTLPGTGGKIMNLHMLTNAGYTNYVGARVNNNVFELIRVDGGATTTASSGITAVADTWYCLEILRNATTDHAELWINGVSKATIDAAITNDLALCVLQAYGTAGVPTIDIYADCVVVADKYIGSDLVYLKLWHDRK